MASRQMSYFSVRFTTKMQGSRFIPAVCYKLDDQLQLAVEKLAEQGDARIYPEEVRFVSGEAIPVKKHVSSEPVLSSVSAVEAPVVPLGGTGKPASRRSGGTGPSRRDFL